MVAETTRIRSAFVQRGFALSSKTSSSSSPSPVNDKLNQLNNIINSNFNGNSGMDENEMKNSTFPTRMNMKATTTTNTMVLQSKTRHLNGCNCLSCQPNVQKCVPDAGANAKDEEGNGSALMSTTALIKATNDWRDNNNDESSDDSFEDDCGNSDSSEDELFDAATLSRLDHYDDEIGDNIAPWFSASPPESPVESPIPHSRLPGNSAPEIKIGKHACGDTILYWEPKHTDGQPLRKELKISYHARRGGLCDPSALYSRWGLTSSRMHEPSPQVQQLFSPYVNRNFLRFSAPAVVQIFSRMEIDDSSEDQQQQ